MTSERTALVVGAGIGGLAAALALRRAGWQVRVFERAAAPRELGFGIGLAPNAAAALRELGVADVLPRRIAPVTAEIRRPDGRLLRRISATPDIVSSLDDPPALIMRPVLHTALLNAVGADTLALGNEAAGVDIVDGRPVLHLANGATATGEILIGADGAASRIRSVLHPDEQPPLPSGYLALRGASPAVGELGDLQFLGYLGRGIEVGMAQASDTAVYWYVSLLTADVGDAPREPKALLERFTPHFDRQFHAIASATPPADLRVDELLARPPLDRWGEGPVTLLGDAAHPMLPHTGQGAAQALEDAVALGLAVRKHADAIMALREYERVRSRRTRRIVAMGPRIAAVTTTRNPLLILLRDSGIRLAPQRAIIRAFVQSTPHDPHAELR